jgi:hypothetical protein
LAGGGLLYTSSSSGATLTETNVPPADQGGVAVSANGSELAAVIYGGAIYTEQTSDPPMPALRISIADGNLVLSWPFGRVNYVLQQRADVSGVISWADEAVTPVASNGYNRVSLPLSRGQGLFRLRKQ